MIGHGPRALVVCGLFVLGGCSSSGNGGASPADAAGGGDGSVTDAGLPGDGAPIDDAGALPGTDASSGCGAFAGDPVFTCSSDGNARGKCAGDASLDLEACPNGCLREPTGQDSICMGTTDTWSCTGSYGTTPAQNGDYYVSEFGCWIDADGGAHTDPGDNCIPSCFDQAKAAGLCDPNGTGADCEQKLDWYTADGARFGCLQRLRVTNPANGKSLIAIALDFGPACSGEAKVQHAVLDSSGAIDDYLFGGAQGGVDKALVHVVEVDDSTPLGPQ